MDPVVVLLVCPQVRKEQNSRKIVRCRQNDMLGALMEVLEGVHIRIGKKKTAGVCAPNCKDPSKCSHP